MSAICRTFSRINSRRFFSTPTVRKDIKPAESETSGTKQGPASYEGLNAIQIGKVQKYLMYYGSSKYKSVAEIPDIVSGTEYHGARTKARVKIANWLCVWFVGMALLNIFIGKKKHEEGQSLSKMSLDRHAKWEAEKAAAAAAAESKSG